MSKFHVKMHGTDRSGPGLREFVVSGVADHREARIMAIGTMQEQGYTQIRVVEVTEVVERPTTGLISH